MRTLTSPNPNHPKTWLKNTLQKAKEHYRTRSTPELQTLSKLGPGAYRHKCIEALVAQVEAEFKKSWEAQYGYPFDDVLDSSRFHRRLAEAQMRQQGGPPLVDAFRITNLAGRVITREEFDALPKHEQDHIKSVKHNMMMEVHRAGFGGMQPNGVLVDRRVHPDALPIAANTQFGIPDPKPVAPIPNEQQPATN